MTALALAPVAAIVWLFGEVLKSLVTNLIGDWLLRLIARWIVRYQASTMGEQSARCKEEWLAHLNETSEGWAQLKVALRLLQVPLNTFIEECWDAGLRRATLASIRERGALFTVPIAVLLVTVYPPDQTRFAAYPVAIPLLVVCALTITPHCRRALAISYERLNYMGRIVTGGLAVPAIVYFVVVWGWVAPSKHPPKRAVVGSIAATRSPLVVIPALPLDIDSQETMGGNEYSGSPAPTRVSPSSDFFSRRQPRQNNNGLLGTRTLPILMLSELQYIPLPKLPTDDELLSARTMPDLNTSELPEVNSPKQPLPSVRDLVPTGGVPSAPTNLHLVP
jgi:hypothetical protein